MARGHPDWGESAAQVMVSGVLDAGELAARLGSPVLFSRSGTVLWFDAFESGALHWVTTIAGVGSGVTVTITTAYTGTASCKLATGGGASDTAAITRRVVQPAVSKIGVEYTFAHTGTSLRFDLSVGFESATARYTMQVRVNASTGQVSIWTPTGFVVVATRLAVGGIATAFSSLKIVGDPDTGKYVRLYYDGDVYDLSAYSLIDAGAPTGNVQFTIQLTGSSGFAAALYVDNVIVTINEP